MATAKKFLDSEGLKLFQTKLKEYFVKKDGSKVLSEEDFTHVLKTKLDDQENYELPIAGADKLGGVMVGDRLSIAEDGKLSANEVTWENLEGKPTDFKPSTHEHSVEDVTDLQEKLDEKANTSHEHVHTDISDWDDELEKKADATHNHTQEQVTGLADALAGKLGKTEKADSSKSADKVANALTAGEKTFDGSSAVELTASDVGAAEESHTHEIADVNGLETKIKSEIAAADHLKRQIVEQLPEVGAADQNTIYMIKLEDGGSEGNLYVEYMVIEGKLEKMGTNEVDMTGYLKEADITTISDEDIESIMV